MTEVIADYTHFDYKKAFWEGQNREYEDFCDRLALRRLLPEKGGKLADLCGGYGRLTPEYINRFAEIHLFDFAENLLAQARKAYGGRIITAQGSIYKLPYAQGAFDVCLLVRATHHLQDFPAAIRQISHVLKPGGRLIIEVANKRNLLEIARWCLGRSALRPFAPEPASRNEKGFYNFHPAYAEQVFKQTDFKIKKILAVSLFRNNFLKRICGCKLLCFGESLLQEFLGFFKLSPSLYYLLEKKGSQDA